MPIRVVIACLFLSAVPAQADTIAIIGTGSVGAALGPEFAAQGHTIIYGSREPGRKDVQELVARSGAGSSASKPAKAVVGADIVVLAVPGLLVEEITLGLGDLDGKVIIDPTNPLDDDETGIIHAAPSSNAEIIQAAAPGARVVKAFNTLSWATMIDPDSSGGPVSIPLAGDDADAKKQVADLAEKMGLDPIDVGPLAHAHWVEGFAILLLNNRFGSDRPDFEVYLRKN